MRAPSESGRLHGLDTLRGLAVVFVVLLHAGIPYMVRPLPHLVWPAVDCLPCVFVDGAAWWIECFIMPLFFLLAGFFSAGLIGQLGPRTFFRHRTQRLLWPLLAACAVVLPACIYLWALGWVADGLFVPGPLLKLGIPAELRADLFGTAHLWFLQYLYLYCLILCGTKVLRNRCGWIDRATKALGTRIGWRFHQLVPLAWKLSLLAVASAAAILYWDPRIVLGFHQSFLPVVSKLLYYAVFYFTGSLLYANHRSLMLRASYGRLYILVATAAFVLILPLIREHVTAELTGLRRLLLASLVAAFGWLMAYGLFESFLLARRGSNRVTRYLSQASYWIYVVHLPFVVLAQIAIARLPIPASLKFLVSAMIAMFLALMTYQVFVRRTWVGDCLNGPARCDVREAAIPLLPRVVIPEIPALTAACAQLASSSISPSPGVLGAVNLPP